MFSSLDDGDFNVFSKFKWQAHSHGLTFCATRSIRTETGRKTLYLHREIMKPKDEDEIDHKDLDGLNNQRSNLRLCSFSENMKNRRRQKSNTSGFKGVSWWNSQNKWTARVTVNGKRLFLGYFDCPKKAYERYCEEARRVHGEFARAA